LVYFTVDIFSLYHMLELGISKHLSLEQNTLCRYW